MANEMVHGSVGTTMTQAEFEAVGLHVCNSQATGDLIYASSATQLTRLGIGSAGNILWVTGGLPAWASLATAGIAPLASPTFTGVPVMPNLQLTFTGSGAGIDNIQNIGKNNATDYLSITGGIDAASAVIYLFGKSHGTYPGQIWLSTPNAALAETLRLKISGAVNTAVLTLTNTNCIFNLPTSNPGAGILWANSGIVTVGT